MKKLTFLEYVVDNQRGPGTTPNNSEIDYFGFVVKMKPSMFLNLASPLQNEKSVEFFRERIKNKEGIASPTLYINVPGEWKQEEFGGEIKVHSHEGRNRMTAIMKEEGDVPVEVHIILRSKTVEWRSKNISTKIKNELNKGCNKENTNEWVKGPLFKHDIS